MKKKNELDRMLFASIKSVLELEGFSEIREERLVKIYKRYKIVPPNVPRTEDVMERISFIKEINGYIIYVHTSYNKQKKTFSPGTRLFFVVVDIRTGEKRLTRKFNRQGAFDKKVHEFADFLVSEFENRWPLTEKNKYATLVEISHDKYVWRDGEKGKVLRDFFFWTDLYPSVQKGQQARLAYRKRRKVLQIKKNLRNLKKKYKSRK